MSHFISAVERRMDMLVHTPWYPIAVFLLAYAFHGAGQYLLALYVMVGVCTLLCFTCRDIVPMLLPLLLCFCVAPFCVGDMPAFVQTLWVVIPAVLALLYRVIRDHRHVRLGPTFPGLVAAAIAVILGGVGSLPASDYFSTASLYHILGLSVLPIAIYLIVKTNRGLSRHSDLADQVALYAYLALVFIVFSILRTFFVHPDILTSEGIPWVQITNHMPWRNNLANYAIALFPFVFYYARSHGAIHVLSACIAYFAITITASRGAFVCGGIVLVLCFLYFLQGRPDAVVWWVTFGACALVACLFFREELITFFARFTRIGTLDPDNFNDPRLLLFQRGWEDFCAHPFNGTGLGYQGNADCYSEFRNGWRLIWYHSAIPQVIGSMGILGILGYGLQLCLRCRLCFRLCRRKNAFAVPLALSYFALLLYSQVDPGLFNPLPFAVLAVLLFLLLEHEEEAPFARPALSAPAAERKPCQASGETTASL